MIKAYHRQLLRTIIDAHDRLQPIPADQWNDDQFYNRADRTSNLFGHYVRSLAKFAGRDPGTISFHQYMLEAAPLSNAINVMIDFIEPDQKRTDMDAYRIASGMHPRFNNQCPYLRCMEMFKAFLAKFPRETIAEPA